MLLLLECCRGDIVMKTETTTQKPEVKKVVLITGGYSHQDTNATLHSAEIFLPNSPGNPCILPDLPARYYAHTQDSGMMCGGYYTQNTCRKWSPIEGNFPEKPVDSFKPGRYFLVSWTPVSEKETFLMGGGSGAARSSINIVKPEGLPPAKFNLSYPIYGACSIPWPEKDSVIITGGNTDSPQYKRTTLYNEKGFVENLGPLQHQRYHHGCTSYVADNNRVCTFIVL